MRLQLEEERSKTIEAMKEAAQVEPIPSPLTTLPRCYPPIPKTIRVDPPNTSHSALSSMTSLSFAPPRARSPPITTDTIQQVPRPG
jgi:hypothetical protein